MTSIVEIRAAEGGDDGPFTAKWHRLQTEDAFSDLARQREFRTELETLRRDLRNYSKLLAEVSGVEDLTELENNEQRDRNQIPL